MGEWLAVHQCSEIDKTVSMFLFMGREVIDSLYSEVHTNSNE